MNKQRLIIITALVAAVILVLIGITVYQINQRVEQACFDNLATASRHLADDLYDSITTDSTVLAAMAAIIAHNPQYDDHDLCAVMESYKSSASYISYIELLRPDGTMLYADGSVRDVSAAFSFADEAAQGAYISGVTRSTRDPAQKVVRNAVPVLRNGQTVSVLYGVIRLSEFVENYRSDIYGGHAYVYLIDGDTGDYLLDTWHKSLGNVNDLGKRETLPGYDLEDLLSGLREGGSGDIGFIAKTTGQPLYLHYEPVGINNWSVNITVEEQYAFRESQEISFRLYVMAAVLGVVLVLYMIYVTWCLFRAYRRLQQLGMEDQCTDLQNRNAYDKFVQEQRETVFAEISCVYVDVNGLHEINNKYGHAVGDQMLRVVADALRSQFERDSIYRVGGDEFIVFSASDSLAVCSDKMQEVIRQVEAHDYSIACGMVSYKHEVGLERIIHEADERMLMNKRDYYIQHDRRRR